MHNESRRGEPSGRSAGEPPAPPGHALVLDDEAALVDVAIRILKSSGRTGSGFTEAGAAIRAFETNPGGFDIVVTDMRLRDTTGVAVGEELTRIRPGVPILLVSGAPLGVDLWDLAADAGIQMVLYKPYRIHEFLDAVRHLESFATTLVPGSCGPLPS